MKKKSFLFIVIMIYLVFLPWGCSKKPAGRPDLSPAGWPEGELKKYAKLNLETGLPKPAAAAGKGMVVGASGPLAIRAGVEALKKGGSAADAALTTSLAQVCLLAGSNVSYAGIIFMLYYDAKTGKIHSMHGGWNSVKEETEKKEKPFLATSCIGSIHEATSQCVLNVLDYNMEPQKAAEMPLFFTPALLPSESNKQTVGEGSFAEEILEAVRAMGQEIKVLPPEKQWLQVGGWVGIKIDPKTGKLTGGVSLILNGVAAGY